MPTYIEPRLSRPINYISRMFSGASLSGSSSRKVGDIELANGDGFYDDMVHDYIWEDRAVEVYVGAKEWNFDQFRKTLVAKVKDLTWSDDVVNVKIHDNKKIFDDNIQSEKYLGTGGSEGSSEMEGTYKPLCYGYCRNITPVLIDAVSLIYQVHAGSIGGITVYFAGLLVTEGQGYTADLDNGTFTLLNSAGGVVTCDVFGSAGPNGDNYTNTTSELIRRIAEDNSDLVWPDDFDTASFENLNRAKTYEQGAYIRNGNLSIKVILDSLMNAINGYWFFDRIDRLHVKTLGLTGSFRSYNDDTISKITREVTPIPIWSVDVSYGRNFNVMDESALAGALDKLAYYPGRKAWLLEEYRTTNASDTDIQDVHSDYEQVILTNLRLLVDAEYQATRRLLMFGTERSIYKIELPIITHDLQIGHGIIVTRSRFGLDNGQVFIITAVQENARTNKTLLEVWG